MRQFSPSAFLPQLRDGEDGVHLAEHIRECWGGAFRCAKGARNKWPEGEERRGEEQQQQDRGGLTLAIPLTEMSRDPRTSMHSPWRPPSSWASWADRSPAACKTTLGTPRLLSVPDPEGSGVAPAGSHASLLAADLPREDVARCPYPSARALAELAEDVSHNVPR